MQHVGLRSANHVILGTVDVLHPVVYHSFVNADLIFGGTNGYVIGCHEWCSRKYIDIQVFNDKGIEV